METVQNSMLDGQNMGFPLHIPHQSIDKNGGKSNSKLSPCFSLEIG